MEFWGGGWIYAPDYEPTGDELWSCIGSGASVQYAGSDSGGYCDPQAESDILATETSSDVQAMYTYENYLAKQLPVIWLPTCLLYTSSVRYGSHCSANQVGIRDQLVCTIAQSGIRHDHFRIAAER